MNLVFMKHEMHLKHDHICKNVNKILILKDERDRMSQMRYTLEHDSML